MARRLFGFFVATWAGVLPAQAINGGISGPPDLAAQTAMIVSTRGSYCTGTVIARDLLITAAHCVQPSASYAVSVESNGRTRIVQVAKIVLHPKYDPNQFETRKPSPDMAILKLSESFPANYQPARISAETALPRPGDNFVLAGYGFARDGDERSLGKFRSVSLPAVGTTGGIMVRLSAGSNSTNGACTGDSGGPAFRKGEFAGVIGWISTPAGKNCGFVTGVTLAGIQRAWIVETVLKLGSRIQGDRDF